MVLRRWIITLICFLYPFASGAAQPIQDYEAFAKIPILHEGRIKPLDSFARVMLKSFSGQESLPNASAVEWLTEVLFAPSKAIQEPLFYISSPDIVRVLALQLTEGNRYTFNELAEMLTAHQELFSELAKKDKKTLSAEQKELIAFSGKANIFADLLGSFSLMLPLGNIDAQTQKTLGLSPSEPVTYLDVQKTRELLEAREKDILKRKKDNIKTYTNDELRILSLAARLSLLDTDRSSALLRIIPPFWEQNGEWLSPWAVIVNGKGSPETAQLFKSWQDMARAYQAHDEATWQRDSAQILSAGVNAEGVRSWALSLEVLYNHMHLFTVSLLFYGLAALLIVTAFLRKILLPIAWSYTAATIGAATHLTGILMRIAILERPPVSTLYESLIFVSFVIIAAGLWLERKKQNGEILLACLGIASFLLAASHFFSTEGDTLGVLIAVLNTNFWLATHVICITTGYATSCLTGVLAHVYLFKRARHYSEDELAPLHKRIHQVALIALLFTSVGTMLGGIWADQSWGRFWGWDPKENGALLIVLWLIWLLHARIAGQVRSLGFAVGMALINIVVALAWVGVNLLSVGLHSYGFTDAAAGGLVAFCFGELVFVGTCLLFTRRLPRFA